MMSDLFFSALESSSQSDIVSKIEQSDQGNSHGSDNSESQQSVKSLFSQRFSYPFDEENDVDAHPEDTPKVSIASDQTPRKASTMFQKTKQSLFPSKLTLSHEKYVTVLSSSKGDEKKIIEVKAAHELQEEGLYHELVEDIEYILDGLIQKQQPLPLRLSCALGLIKKLSVEESRSHLRTTDLLPRIVSAFSSCATDGDTSFSFSNFLFLLVLSADGRDLVYVAKNSTVISTLFTFLQYPSDSLSSLCRDYQPISSKWISFISSLPNLPIFLSSQSKSATSVLYHSSDSVKAIALSILHAVFSTTSSPMLHKHFNQLSGLSYLMNLIRTDDQNLRYHALRLIECLIVGNTQHRDMILDNDKVPILSLLLNIVQQYFAIANVKDDMGLLISSLRVLVNLTHDISSEHCQRFRLSEYFYLIYEWITMTVSILLSIKSDNESLAKADERETFTVLNGHHSILDVHILLVALFVNLIDNNGEHRQFLQSLCLEVRRNGYCPCEKQRAYENMVHRCSFVSVFSREFQKMLRHEGSHSTEMNIALAYHAVAIGCLVKDNERNAELVSEELEGKNFDEIIKILNQFVQFVDLMETISSRNQQLRNCCKDMIDVLRRVNVQYQTKSSVLKRLRIE